jgi:DNA-binding NtrC family response regulator
VTVSFSRWTAPWSWSVGRSVGRSVSQSVSQSVSRLDLHTQNINIKRTLEKIRIQRKKLNEKTQKLSYPIRKEWVGI